MTLVAKRRTELEAVLAEKFGKSSEMYEAGLAVFDAGPTHGIPAPYAKFWQPFATNGELHHITLEGNVASIRRDGLEPHDPFPRPWAGMRAVYMGDPGDPMYRQVEHKLVAHALKKGEHPVLLRIRTEGRLYKSTEPGRTFQVISLNRVPPEDIVAVD